VQYELAVFREGEDEACAAGTFVHVFVERATNQPASMTQALREALERLA
jgi:acyl-CoA thioester hydrolase